MSIYGAKWWKVDFHVHTPASDDYNENDKNTSPKDFLLNVMSKKIDCIIVSDHNNCNWIENLQNAYMDMKQEKELYSEFRDVYIFPAFEFGEATPNAHLLCVFDINKLSNDIQTVLGKLNGKTFSDCLSIVSSSGGIAIPAHVDDEIKGLFKKLSNEETLTNNIIQNFNKGNFYAVEVINKETNCPQMFIDNKVFPTKIVGSDSHSLDSLGEKYTWVKMQEPDINALRLALFDNTDGVIRYDENSNDPNSLENTTYIKSIEISKAQKVGNNIPLKIQFSPWLNTIIGGRGSGKSALINFLRIGLNQNSNMDELTKNEFNNFNKIPVNRGDGMLRENTVVSVILHDKTQEYRLTYSHETELIKEEMLRHDGTWQEIANTKTTEQNYPLAIYNQKQVYNLTRSPDTILEMIDKMCDIELIKGKIDNVIDQYCEICREIRRLQKSLLDEEQINRNKQRNETQLEAAQQSGISELLKQYSEFTEYDKKFNRLQEIINEYVQNTQPIKAKLSSIIIDDYLLDEDMKEKCRGTNEKVSEYLAKFNKTVSGIISAIDKLSKMSWDTVEKELTFSLEFEKIKTQMSVEKARLAEQGIEESINVQDLLDEKSAINSQLESIKEVKKQIEDSKSEKEKLKNEIFELIFSINIHRKEKIEEINSANDYLKIELNEFGNILASEKNFRRAIAKEDKTFSKEIYENDDGGNMQGIIYQICSADNVSKKIDLRNNFIKKIFDLCESDIDCDIDGRFKAYLKKLSNENPEFFDKLAFWLPDDELKLSLIANGSVIPVSSGSAGQRVAGMLAFLLSINDKPIIIDQPEEDLDTQLISSFVVENFKNLKHKQQLIIVTHNPNIPVNAAAENIIVMDFKGGQILCNHSGALQLEEIRKDICTIMEGGKDALDKRYFRVSKALN